MRAGRTSGLRLARTVAAVLVAPVLGWIGLMVVPYDRMAPFLRDRLVLAALVALATGFLLGAMQPRLWWLLPILTLAWIPPYLLVRATDGTIVGDWTMAPITAVFLLGWLSVCLLASRGANVRFGRGRSRSSD